MSFALPTKIKTNDGRFCVLKIEDAGNGARTATYEYEPVDENYFFMGSYGKDLDTALSKMREMLIDEGLINCSTAKIKRGG